MILVGFLTSKIRLFYLFIKERDVKQNENENEFKRISRKAWY